MIDPHLLLSMNTKLPNLIPPFRFTIVEENVFRGGYPKPRNMRFLKRLKLKTILSLIPDKLMHEMQEFSEKNHIHLLHLKVDKMKEDNIPLTYNQTILALQILMDPSNHPIYIHCLDGADVTGLVIACLRKIQMWSASSAMIEFSRHLHTNVVSGDEFEFIENFKNFEIKIPMTIPPWLWGGKVTFRKHSSLRLKFLNPEMMTEEERELKDLKEKREKEKEDYYKRRKNDLLDNLFDPNAQGGRHRQPSGSSSLHTGNNALLLSSNNLMKDASPLTSPLANSLAEDNDPFATTLSQLQADDTEHEDDIDDTKDPYLVDVDVDVEGVMMDGVGYMNCGGSVSGINRFYGDDDDDILLTDEGFNEVYGAEQGTRYTMEPISRMLEALALEGLTEF
ncbi:tyrosine phosphatase family-domain-containing protein [Pilobolus umbonatus]|nr:tyrosine phosphatase family-domain-containing protein [Pilobolus umbonatus]